MAWYGIVVEASNVTDEYRLFEESNMPKTFIKINMPLRYVVMQGGGGRYVWFKSYVDSMLLTSRSSGDKELIQTTPYSLQKMFVKSV